MERHCKGARETALMCLVKYMEIYSSCECLTVPSHHEDLSNLVLQCMLWHLMEMAKGTRGRTPGMVSVLGIQGKSKSVGMMIGSGPS